MAEKTKATTTFQANVGNSKSITTVTKVIELIVVNDKLVVDNKDLNPGIFSV